MRAKSIPSDAPAPDDLMLVSVAAAAERLGVTEGEVRDLMDDGRLRYYRIGARGVLRVRTSDVERFRLDLVEDGTPVGVPDHADLAQRMVEMEREIARLREIIDALARKRLGQRTQRSRSQTLRIVARDGANCRYCGKRTTAATRTIDHLIPVALGGDNEDINLVVACASCNSAKGARYATDRGMSIRPSPGASDEINDRQRLMAEGVAKLRLSRL